MPVDYDINKMVMNKFGRFLIFCQNYSFATAYIEKQERKTGVPQKTFYQIFTRVDRAEGLTAGRDFARIIVIGFVTTEMQAGIDQYISDFALWAADNSMKVEVYTEDNIKIYRLEGSE